MATKTKKRPAKKAAKKKVATKKVKEEILHMPSNHFDIKNPSDVEQLIAHVKEFVTKHKAYHEEQDTEGVKKKFPLVHAYQFAGTLLGMSGKVQNIQMVMRPGNIANIMYQSEGLLYNANGDLLQNGIGFCEAEEGYSTHSSCSSMAQTRSMAKAYRLNIGWIMRAAGFEDTPGEEMQATRKKTGDMTKDDFEKLFFDVLTEADAKKVINTHKKYQNNVDFKVVAQKYLDRGKEYDRAQNPA